MSESPVRFFLLCTNCYRYYIDIEEDLLCLKCYCTGSDFEFVRGIYLCRGDE